MECYFNDQEVLLFIRGYLLFFNVSETWLRFTFSLFIEDRLPRRLCIYSSVVDAKEEEDKCFISDRGFKEQSVYLEYVKSELATPG